MLSRGARLCESIIRASKAHKGGVRTCGRPYLARRLGCSVRTVSRYLKELRDAGRLEVTPPRRVRTPKGWRCAGVNAYRLPCRPNHAPHVHNRRSSRGATGVTPTPKGVRGGRAQGAGHPPVDDERPLINPADAIAAIRERLKASSAAA